MKRIKMVLAGIAVSVMGLFMAATPAMAIECPQGTRQAGTDLPSLAQCNLPPEETGEEATGLWSRIQTIINWVLAALGLVAVIMVIIGGFTYLTSQGDPGKTKKGRDTILYGIIGLIIALLAYAIVNFVLSSIFGNSSGTTGSTGNNGTVTTTYTVTTNN